MPDIRKFATDEYPLRASSLYWVRCQMKHALQFLGAFGTDEGGPAAQTGSLAHAGIEEWHRTSQDKAAALRHMSQVSPKFPVADRAKAEKHAEGYFADPRNQAAEVVHIEDPVLFSFPPAKEDATGQPIVIRGTLDQIRRVDGVLKLFDVKTGSPEGLAMIHDYALQVAAYCVGATKKYGVDVHPGAIIRTEGYMSTKRKKVDPASAPGGVFWDIPWNLERCAQLLDGVRSWVAQIRAGRPAWGPGSWCLYCPARELSVCAQMYDQLCEKPPGS
jgi:hypothetical protein